MSSKHPVVAVTGSSGAGTTTVKDAFEHIFFRENINPAIIEGDSYHRYDRAAMKVAVEEKGDTFSHFGPEANHFDILSETFKEYGDTGMCKRRYYLHSDEEAAPYAPLTPGQFTDWENIPSGTDLLFYEGLHGGAKDGDTDVSKNVDLLVGVVPIVNLEWIQKIHRDNAQRGYSAEATVDTILRRMPDYINYITPQFSRTDINFQRVPTVDTSNPFIARDIPTPDESFIVIRFKNPENVDFPYLLNMIPDSFMSRRNNMVVPGSKMGFAMELILAPRIHDLMEKSKD
ncbi:MAG: phosphoribulokinase [gamma proteobacterium symbiont of Bathyaustriella thionipta]|nr:phosphoribulokinase [gamma proteobacterium symbiont of Bathyaustriella thionipta]MCU7950904.1 phosphoribulokinase [gamma proteobacterium symbiont of Bathyaustriella thionipta]MCU7952646.1 phosphoribulokinase [gamma proteobacterium symbiont of Bathyaustriella thionipta]MCU7955523.1 phosphoribulokinase [gamma proteobacterium symbiont of Bathyaustriella thionipta]MCU7968575.1 phosphoribulokinase [gamma proteobacterium symbiont of Bathyaustriella thionipta]